MRSRVKLSGPVKIAPSWQSGSNFCGFGISRVSILIRAQPLYFLTSKRSRAGMKETLRQLSQGASLDG